MLPLSNGQFAVYGFRYVVHCIIAMTLHSLDPALPMLSLIAKQPSGLVFWERARRSYRPIATICLVESMQPELRSGGGKFK